jgi:class 3 adenylate cyclase/tetratricopeptide (TPR) repeat protein
VATCPNCGKELSGEFRFCPNCGTALTGGTSPRHEERKVVSVLFCDLVGFTAASERADPEDVRARLQPYHRELRTVIEHHGGTVEKFVGDAVMAVFGAPLAHEDDAERAVRAGLRIVEALDELNNADPTLELQVRIGINTGEAVVALGARPERGEGFVTGDVVNTASRLQGIAPVNGIAASEVTYRQTERVFTFVPLEPVRVKGKAEPLASWQPVAPRARFGADVIRTYMTPLVGRKLERPLLIAAFERTVEQRACQLVTIAGEPGVGKSRLCAELLSYVEGRPGLVRWRQGRSLPYGEAIPFWALGEIVKAECGILESDTPEEVMAKLDHAIPADEQDRMWLKQRLAPLVGAGGEPAAQEESFTAWRRFLEGLAASSPTVLVFEDLHWADDAMLAFLEHLAEWSEDVPLFLLCTARPELHERHPTWASAVRNAQRINLGPLTDTETATLLSVLLEHAVLPAATQQALIDRAGGNPLYAEEFVRLLGDRDLLGGALEDVALPDSLQALIAARLDTLSPDRKALLQDAAVVGKVFWAGALAAMGSRDLHDVERALHELARKELVRSVRGTSMQGEQEYGFWHVLVRDVCYAQIPRPDRAARHRAAAAWIEAKAGERVDDLADVLAYHYVQALELVRASGQLEDIPVLETAARHYLGLAGARALPIDVVSAGSAFARALELAPAGHPERAGLLERWAMAVQQQGRPNESKQAFEEALAIYRAQGSILDTGRVLTVLPDVLRTVGASQAEHDAVEEAISLLEGRDAGPELVAAYAAQAQHLGRGTAYANAIHAAERSISIASELMLPQPASALGVRGTALAALGEESGIEDMRRALALAVEQGSGRVAGVLHNNLAWVVWQYRGPLAALEMCREGIAFCERRGIAEMARAMTMMGLTFLAEAGRCDEALEGARVVGQAEMLGDLATLIEGRAVLLSVLSFRGASPPSDEAERFVEIARELGEPQDFAMAFSIAAHILLENGDRDRAKAVLDDVRHNAATRDDPNYAAQLPQLVRSALALGDAALSEALIAGVAPRTPLQQHALRACAAELAEASGDHAGAVDRYREAADGWRVFGHIPELAHALFGQGRSLVASGASGADVPLTEARELFQAMGYAPAVTDVEALLSEAAKAAS